MQIDRKKLNLKCVKICKSLFPAFITMKELFALVTITDLTIQMLFDDVHNFGISGEITRFCSGPEQPIHPQILCAVASPRVSIRIFQVSIKPCHSASIFTAESV